MCKIRRIVRPFDFQLIQIQQNVHHNQIPATLQSIEYKCQIINNILKTTLIQTFQSQSNNEFSETQYMFPIEENICLESFEARYNDKTVKGIIKAKEDAQKEYQQNKSQGNLVSYAETKKNQRDQHIKIMIGNLPPSAQVEIVLTFSQQLESILNKYYVAYIPLQYVEDEISVKLGKNVLTLDLFCTGKISYATSKGYPAEKTMIDDNTARFTLSQAFLQKDIDFQLIFSYDGMFDPQVILGSSKVYHEDQVKRNILPIRNSAMVTFIPNFNKELTQEIDDTIRAAIMNGDDILSDEFQQKLNQELIDHLNSSKSEFIFLLDRSGSMSGKPIQKAVEALTLFLQSLPNDSYFNVVSFGHRFQKLFPQSNKYNSKTMNEAISKISKYTADLGGTEIYEPLQDVFNQIRIKGYNKQIFLLTDGEVSQPENVVNLIKKNNKFNRVHSIGFGSGADKFLIEQSSVAGKGIYKIIELNSDLSEVIINMLSSSITPTYDDFTLSYDQSIFESAYPNTNFPCVFKDEIINIHLFFKPLVDIQSLTDAQKVIQIEYYDSQLKQKVKKEIRLEMSDCFTCNTDLQESVFKLGKLLQINNSITNQQEPIDFQLLTESTALICVIEQLNDEKKIMFQNINNQSVYSNIQFQNPQQNLIKKKSTNSNQLRSLPTSMVQKPQQKVYSQRSGNQMSFNSNISQVSSAAKPSATKTSAAMGSQQNINLKYQDEQKRLSLGLNNVGNSIKSSELKKDYKKTNSIQLDGQAKQFEKQRIQNNYKKSDSSTNITELSSSKESIVKKLKKPLAASTNRHKIEPENDIDQDLSNYMNLNSITQVNNECLKGDLVCSPSSSSSISQNAMKVRGDLDIIEECKQSFFEEQQQQQEKQMYSQQQQMQQQQQQQQQHLKYPTLNLENILKLVDFEGIWKYDEKLIQQCANLAPEIVNEFISYFKNKDTFMTIFILCILEIFYKKDKSKWVLISKKSTSYIKKNLNENNEFNTIQQKLINSIQV